MLLAGHAPVQHRIDDDLFDVRRQTEFARLHRYQLELQQGIDERHPIAGPGDPASGPCNERSETTASFHLIVWVTDGIRCTCSVNFYIYFSEPLSRLSSSRIVKKYFIGPALHSFFVLVSSARKTHNGLWPLGLFNLLRSVKLLHFSSIHSRLRFNYVFRRFLYGTIHTDHLDIEQRWLVDYKPFSMETTNVEYTTLTSFHKQNNFKRTKGQTSHTHKFWLNSLNIITRKPLKFVGS